MIVVVDADPQESKRWSGEVVPNNFFLNIFNLFSVFQTATQVVWVLDCPSFWEEVLWNIDP